jgi:hypothetical protein
MFGYGDSGVGKKELLLDLLLWSAISILFLMDIRIAYFPRKSEAIQMPVADVTGNEGTKIDVG